MHERLALLSARACGSGYKQGHFLVQLEGQRLDVPVELLALLRQAGGQEESRYSRIVESEGKLLVVLLGLRHKTPGIGASTNQEGRGASAIDLAVLHLARATLVVQDLESEV